MDQQQQQLQQQKNQSSDDMIQQLIHNGHNSLQRFINNEGGSSSSSSLDQQQQQQTSSSGKTSKGNIKGKMNEKKDIIKDGLESIDDQLSTDYNMIQDHQQRSSSSATTMTREQQLRQQIEVGYLTYNLACVKIHRGLIHEARAMLLGTFLPHLQQQGNTDSGGSSASSSSELNPDSPDQSASAKSIEEIYPKQFVLAVSFTLLELLLLDQKHSDSGLVQRLMKLIQSTLENSDKQQFQGESKLYSIVKARQALMHARLSQECNPPGRNNKFETIADDADKISEKDFPTSFGTLISWKGVNPSPHSARLPSAMFIRAYQETMLGKYKESCQIMNKIFDSQSPTDPHGVQAQVAALNNIAYVCATEDKYALSQIFLRKAMDKCQENGMQIPFQVWFNSALACTHIKGSSVGMQSLKQLARACAESSPMIWLKIAESAIRSRGSKEDAHEGMHAANACLMILESQRESQEISLFTFYTISVRGLLCQAWLALDLGYYSSAVASSLKIIAMIQSSASQGFPDSITLGQGNLILAHTYAAEGYARSGRLRDAQEHSKKANEIARTLTTHARTGSGPVGKKKKPSNNSQQEQSHKASSASIALARSFAASNNTILATTKSTLI